MLNCYAPYEEEREYCFAYVGWCVRPSVDQMVSDHYFKYYLSQGFHISHAKWSWYGQYPY